MREAVGLVPGDLLGQEPARRRPAGRAAAAPPSSRTSPAATPPGCRRRTSPGSSACRGRTGGPAPRRRAGWCRTPPTSRRPARTGRTATCAATRANTSGRCSSSQAYCWAEDIANTRSSWVSSRSTTLAVVRATLRTVSRSGHSQAESMCACPTAESRWALACAGAARVAASAARARRGGARHVVEVERVQRPPQRAQDLPAARVVRRQLAPEPVEHLQVVHQLADGGVPDDHVRARQPVERLVARRRPVAAAPWAGSRRRRAPAGWRPPRRRGRPRPRRDRDPVVARVEPLHHGAVGAVDEPLGLEAGQAVGPAEVDEQLQAVAGRRRTGRHLAGEVEPGRAPGRPPRPAERERRVVGPQGLGGRHRLPGHVPGGDLQPPDHAVGGRPDPLAQHPLQPFGGRRPVVMHECPLCHSRGRRVARWR